MTALKILEDNIVPFSRGTQMADKFDKGYVMSSRLYRYEVRPFLGDAAKNIYAELEDRINGFKDKVTDHVSYSQLQGGKLKGSRKLSTTTVAKGLKELLDLGVISIVSEDSRKGNEYQINEISLVDHFSNKSTTLETKVLQKVKRQHFRNESASTLETKDTIELSRINYRTIHTQENPPQKTQDDSWKPNLDLLTSILRTTKHSQRVSEILGMVDFEFHLGNFNAHWEDKITLTENQKTRKFVSWITQEFEKSERKVRTTEKQNNFGSKPKTALQATKDQWAGERFAEQQNSNVIDVNQDQVLIGGEREYF